MASLPFVEEFTGTDGDPLPAGWVSVLGSWQITDNEAEATAFGSNGAIACIDVGAVATSVAARSTKEDFLTDNPPRPVWGFGWRASTADQSGVWVSLLPPAPDQVMPAPTLTQVVVSELDAAGDLIGAGWLGVLGVDPHGWVEAVEIDATHVQLTAWSTTRVPVDRVTAVLDTPISATGTCIGISGAEMTVATPGGYIDAIASPLGDALTASWSYDCRLRIVYPTPPRLDLTWGYRCDLIIAAVGEQRRTRLVRIDGTLVAELPDAQHGPIEVALNDVNTGSFTVPAESASAAAIQAAELQEVQLWRGNRCLLWGPIVRHQVDGGALTAYVSGAEWYLTRTYIGPDRRHNYLDDAGGFAPAGGVVYLVETLNAPTMRAGRDNVPTYGDGDTITVASREDMDQPQTWVSAELSSVVVPNSTEGIRWFATVWAYIESGSIHGMPSGHAFLTLVRGSTTVKNESEIVRRLQPDAMAIVEISSAVLQPDDVPLNQWFRLECDLTQPQLASGEMETIRMQLAAIPGVIHYSRPGLWADDGLRFRHIDQLDIMSTLVTHAQDPAFDKSALRLEFVRAGGSPFRDRTYVYAEHPNVWDALMDFTRCADGADVRTVYTRGSRMLMAESPHVTRRHTAVRLTDGGEVTGWTITWDGERAATTEITLGEGNGAGREEGVASVTAGFGPDGIRLANVEVASPELPAESLATQAHARLDARMVPWVVQATTRGGSNLAGLLLPGDLILADPPDVPRLWWRIVGVTIHPDDSLELTLNPEAEDG